MSALRGLLRKEVLHVLRDRRTLAVVILMPVLQVILFGYAIRTDINDIRLAIVDPAPDHITLALRNRFTATRLFKAIAVVQSQRELEPLFQSGAIHEAVVFETGFADRLARGEPARVQVITDATDPNSGNAMQGYALLVIQDYERELRTGQAARSQSRSLGIVPEYRMRFNPTRESSNLFVPGVMAFVLTIISCLMTAISLTREKETGTMETLLVSPLRPWQIIIGKVAPYTIIGFISLIAVMVEAYFIFRVPFRGSILLLIAEGMLFILASLSLGILISARTSSQRVAMTGALAGTMLPTIVLSGFIFPLESMPRVLQVIANVVPAKWFVLISRGIMLKGVGLEYLWRETLILLGMTVVLLILSARSFHIRLDQR
jgi:ABC-2 type transport system permease protein